MSEKTETLNSQPPAAATPPQQQAVVPAETPPATQEASTEKPSLLNATPPAETPEPFSLEKFTIPEGFTIGDEVKTSLTEIASKHGLTQAAMTELSAIYFAEQKALGERLAAQIDQTWNQMQETWTKAVHEKFGGEAGAMQAAGRFAPIIDQFGGKELREALDVTGFGNHPAAFAFFAKIAEKMGEATPVNSTAAPAAAPNPLDAMYPSLAKKKG